MRRTSTHRTDKRCLICPQCQKRRMIRELNHVVSYDKQKYKSKNNVEIELFTDICDHCKRNNFTRYFEPSRADVKKILKTLQEEATLSEEDSLEDLL